MARLADVIDNLSTTSDSSTIIEQLSTCVQSTVQPDIPAGHALVEVAGEVTFLENEVESLLDLLMGVPFVPIRSLHSYDDVLEMYSFQLLLESNQVINADTINVLFYSDNLGLGSERTFTLVNLMDSPDYLTQVYEQNSLGKTSDDGGLWDPLLTSGEYDWPDHEWACLLAASNGLGQYYERMKIFSAAGFTGETFIELVTPDIIELLIGIAGGDEREVYENILELYGEGGFEQFQDWMSNVETGVGAIGTAIDIYDSYSSLRRAFLGVYNSTTWNNCAMIDQRFLAAWCQAENFPSTAGDNLADICEDWGDHCRGLEGLWVVDLGFSMNVMNRFLACQYCGYDFSPGSNLEKASNLNDMDDDGVLNSVDNCICIPNPDQEDDWSPGGHGADGTGDACQDMDGDGIINYFDNCDWVYNPFQEDDDEDGVGNACDPDVVGNNINDCFVDSDNDGIVDCLDNCPSTHNPLQSDVDNDYVGDACDNCPDYWNASQQTAPCNGPDPDSLDANCDQEDIEAEQQIFNNINNCMVNAGSGYSQNPVIPEGGTTAGTSERECVESRVSQLGHDVFCTWWYYNPAWKFCGVSICEDWGDFDQECKEYDKVSLNNHAEEISNAWMCCKSQGYSSEIDEKIATITAILACIPSNPPETRCLDLKKSLDYIRQQYQAELQYWQNRQSENSANIYNSCN